MVSERHQLTPSNPTMGDHGCPSGCFSFYNCGRCSEHVRYLSSLKVDLRRARLAKSVLVSLHLDYRTKFKYTVVNQRGGVMKLVMILFAGVAFGKAPVWDFDVKDSRGNELSRAFFEAENGGLVYILDEGIAFADRESPAYKSFALVTKGFARSLPVIPAVVVVRSSYDLQTFNSHIDGHMEGVTGELLKLSVYLRPKLSESQQEHASVDALRTRIRFIQDSEGVISKRFKVGSLDEETPYRVVVLDSQGRAVSME